MRDQNSYTEQLLIHLSPKLMGKLEDRCVVLGKKKSPFVREIISSFLQEENGVLHQEHIPIGGFNISFWIVIAGLFSLITAIFQILILRVLP